MLHLKPTDLSLNLDNKCLLFCCLVADYAKRRYMSLPEKGYNPRHSEEFYRKHLYSLLLQVLFNDFF